VRQALWIFVLAAAPLLTGEATARDTDWAVCTGETDDDNVLIKACTSVVNTEHETDENRAIAFKNLCLGYNNKGDHDRAIENCDQALALKPDFMDALVFRGHAWFNKSDYDHAIADYDRAIALDPNAATTFVQRGAAWHRKKDEVRAIQDLDQAILLDPKDATAFYIRALAHEEQKDSAHALADYSEAIRLAPNFAISLYRRGVLRRALGDVGGDADIAQARRIDPHLGR
jgi:tetratricopeptide (TPR) repeat protein